MKLNFWQILGLILIILAVVFIFRRETGRSASSPPATVPTHPAP
jgi:drug/metabolite transporter (DMT)-like permease